jgi:hypothetical protein
MGNVPICPTKEGGVDAMFFSVYTPENYYPEGLKSRIRSGWWSWRWIR